MNNLKIYTPEFIDSFIKKRDGETKFGQSAGVIHSFDELESQAAKFVLLGIPEDIGIRANQGIKGAQSAWKNTYNALINMQDNAYTNASELLILGEVDCDVLMQAAAIVDPEDEHYHEELSGLVEQLDDIVAPIVEKIVAMGKIPIIIGGGHNNAYPNLKGGSKALKKPINAINIDAHTDLRTPEDRHSGNGFSFAKKEGYLGKYSMLGLQEAYTPTYIWEQIDANPDYSFVSFESTHIRKEVSLAQALDNCLGAISSSKFGLEIDTDVIKVFPASAMTPTGYTIEEVRGMVQKIAKQPNLTYVHLCEAAPNIGEMPPRLVGKALALLVIDIIGGR